MGGKMNSLLDRLAALDKPGRAKISRPERLRLCREARAEIERLLALLKHADDVVIWEHTPARSGFQEEIEAALGIGSEQEGDKT